MHQDSQRFGPQLQPNMVEVAYCEVHLEPAWLFCEDDQVTLCSTCFQSPEHKHHVVHGVQQAAESYRKLFQEILNTLKEKVEVTKSILCDEQERMMMIQEEEQNFKEMIESEYRTRLRVLSEEDEGHLLRAPGCRPALSLGEASRNQFFEAAAELVENPQGTLQRLSHLGRENMNKLKESEVRVCQQICSLQSFTTELEKKCRGPTLALLKDAKYCLERSESLLVQCLQPAHLTDLSLCSPGMSKMPRALHRRVTLDPRTAHPCLVLSEDLRSVTVGNTWQDVPGSPGRFDFGATVLGIESFSSGRHYWEVEVEKATKWQLGICQDPAHRRGPMPTASGDKVLLMGAVMGTECTFWVFPPLKKVSLRKPMHKAGLFLDCEYGHISFYNVTQRTLIYNFSQLPFQGPVRPVFSLCIPNGDTNSDSLTVSSGHAPSRSDDC
ncbi:probable E3 ubiquitin-protein ligase TRIML2 [Nycticebus coucang]|uniref:probable E3 ubiquitin-protein ligase TRIML2 n=1 Tax=Nycticebus coucang TaxID=9470 RepID=UPI00234DE292|nr:probable E3 ubiquitin-protein ligase TRIML2 [Nycticebus coucang]